ncbi:GTP-binding protein [Opitutales bacterium ASA1]|uniref:CobW family GTP-binding protein n=1 Tax=Congregicoccus parvus TaxID=3081749 RepID=UPI002B2B4CB9|nr:GTP-binding protein [Opitutales bacterium ASA1]
MSVPETHSPSVPPRPDVTIVTGFLGAGKTTWLSDVLRRPHGLRVAVVVNDVGAINIDAALVRRVESSAAGGRRDVVELSNGCICCSVRDELAGTIAELAAAEGYDHIVIECSGAAEPQPIVQLFTERTFFGRSIGEFTRLHTVLAVVDTPELLRLARGEARREIHAAPGGARPLSELMLAQIEGADVVALNKADLVSGAAMDEASAFARGLNPRATIAPCTRGVLPDGFWPGPPRFPNRDGSPATWVRVLNAAKGHAAPGLRLQPAPMLVPGSPEAGVYPVRHYALQTFLFAERRPFDRDKLLALLTAGLPGVVRAKGFCWTRENPDEIGFVSIAGGSVEISAVGDWAAALLERGVMSRDEIPPGILALWREPHGDRRQELVFIGVGIDESRLRAALETCLV